ncbi:hypothetical protein D3C72_1869680 [compost metagenome]
MPIVMPVWRSAFMVADAMPERSRGTVAMTAMLVDGTASPMPRPSITISDPDTSHDVCASNRIMASMAAPIRP